MTERPELVYHLADAGEWEAVVASGEPWRRSTIDQTLDEVGFVHCALAHQVAGVVERYHPARAGVVVVTIETARLGAPLVLENTSGGTELFPHLYGPLDPDAVVAVTPLATFLRART